ncbi:hypothetical protein [Streptomyces caniscabiei]|uniref:hypothetical protein n=1 Tax=Streptomyces caniscabiei TaxID=2746961 RepID=UPI0029AC709C|nr:hypothetical protein [Streptomyces caniscabiei]MDX2736395.1 hypothetical protein [Streptomyces caniscabiei]
MNDTTTNLVGGFTCGAIEDGKPCGGELYEGKPYGPSSIRIPLCEKHAANLYTWSTGTYRASPIGQMEEQGLITGHLPGYTYVVQLPNGRIKVGTAREGRVLKRWEEITRDYFKKGYRDPLKPIALLPGGVSKEAALHYRFRSARVTDEFGEQFTPTPELITFAESAGMPSDQADLVPAYEKWWTQYLRENGSTKREPTEEEIKRMAEDLWYFPSL